MCGWREWRRTCCCSEWTSRRSTKEVKGSFFKQFFCKYAVHVERGCTGPAMHVSMFVYVFLFFWAGTSRHSSIASLTERGREKGDSCNAPANHHSQIRAFLCSGVYIEVGISLSHINATNTEHRVALPCKILHPWRASPGAWIQLVFRSSAAACRNLSLVYFSGGAR